MPTDRMRLGTQAEQAVCDHLAAAGYRILERNWRRPWGELDIVALGRDGVVHFVEVKASRASVAGFNPELRAGDRKMAKVVRTARSWLAARRSDVSTEWQLDVASVIMEQRGPRIEIFWNV